MAQAQNDRALCSWAQSARPFGLRLALSVLIAIGNAEVKWLTALIWRPGQDHRARGAAGSTCGPAQWAGPIARISRGLISPLGT